MATVDVAATVEVAALIGINNAKGRFISCSRQLVAGGHRAGCARRQESEELTNHMQIGVPTAGRMLTGESANQQRRVPISNRRAGLEVLGERDVSWKESRHEARQEFSGASVIEVLLLPELSRDERA